MGGSADEGTAGGPAGGRGRPPEPAWAWHEHAACAGVQGDLFFGPERESSQHRLDREARAVEVCAGCPVLGRCRSYALARPESYGVWGGMTEADRLWLRRRRSRSRRAA